MSLNWNLSKIASRRPTGKMTPDCDDGAHDVPCKVCPKRPEVLVHDASGAPIPWAVTNALIWVTMAIQMSGITMDNVSEFALRVAIYQRVHGAWLMTAQGQPRPITTAEVYAHVGLSTNVSTRGRGMFLKTIGESLARTCWPDVQDDLTAEVKKTPPVLRG